MALVLAIEPDLRQAAIVKRIVREKALAEVAVVDSRDAALEAIRLAMPDVLLISALLSPRDEDELIAHLRTLDNADHLQTHTIPQLASALRPGEERGSGGLLSAFRRKKKAPEPAAGCDPDIFAEEIRSYLQRAAEKKRERSEGEGRQDSEEHTWRAAQPQKAVATEPEPAAEPDASSASSWASPFEWKPASSSPSPVVAPLESVIPDPSSRITNPGSLIANPESLIANPESLIADRESRIAHHESLIANPEESPSLMAHLRPPSGITTLKALRDSLAAEAAEVAAPVEVTEPTPILEPPAIRAIVQEVVLAQDAAATPEPAPVQEPVLIGEPGAILKPAPILVAAPGRDKGSKIKDSGLAIRDKGLRIRDQGFGIEDSRLGALASWARSERAGRDAPEKADDMYGLLMGLSVPPAVAAVGYGRGCRIRRVRVPAASEPLSTETNGPVILSKQALAELREHPQV